MGEFDAGRGLSDRVSFDILPRIRGWSPWIAGVRVVARGPGAMV